MATDSASQLAPVAAEASLLAAALLVCAVAALILYRRPSSWKPAQDCGGRQLPTPQADPAAVRRKRAAPGERLAKAMSVERVDESIWDAPPPTAPSQEISAFPSQSTGCWSCFMASHGLNKGVVRRLYTNGKLEQLNCQLACAASRPCDPFTIRYTQLLAEALFEERRAERRGPRRLYRGLQLFSAELQRAYEERVGRRVYFHRFTSTSADPSVALRFAQPSGWRMVIDTRGSAGDCVASVAHLSEYDEQEVLISANAGFRVDAVVRSQRVVRLTLVDETHCLRRRTATSATCHRCQGG